MLGIPHRAAADALRRRSFKGQSAREAAWNAATRLLPCVTWLQRYKWRTRLAKDVAAGIAVAFLIVPQGLSYAGIAGLPAIYGLCASHASRLAACKHLNP